MEKTEAELRKEFLKKHWIYYLMLEKDFLDIERYLTLDEDNFNAFSNEYIKQYQVICSEIDVVAKAYCKELNPIFNGENSNAYCKCIIDNVTDFSDRVISVKRENINVKPWENWSYTETTTEEGKRKIEANNPKWWRLYNKVKHERISIEDETGLPYYKLANQKNVLNALAGLFQLEMYYYRLLRQKLFTTEPDMPFPLSQIFEIENWGNRCQMISDIIFIEHDE